MMVLVEVVVVGKLPLSKRRNLPSVWQSEAIMQCVIDFLCCGCYEVPPQGFSIALMPFC